MGWGRTFLLGDIGNRLDIEDCEKEIFRLKEKSSHSFERDHKQDKQLEELEHEIVELKLYVSTLFRVLNQKGVLSQEDIESIVSILDDDEPDEK